MGVIGRISILLVGMSVQILGWRPFTVRFLNEHHENFHPEIATYNLTIKNGTHVDIEFVILREISQLFVDIVYLQDSGNGAYDMVFMNRTVNACMFLKNTKSNPIFAIVYQMFADQVVDIPKSCPLRQKRYQVKNVFIDPDKYPPFMTDHKAKAKTIAWNRGNGRPDEKRILSKFTVDVVIERSFKRTTVH